MKKFYFFLVALVLGAMSASAASYYLAGGFNGWVNNSSTHKFTAVGDGTYTLTLNEQLTSEFKITDGSWDNCWGNSGSALALGETYTVSKTGGNIQLDCGAVDNPTLVFNPTANTLVITGEEGDVDVSYDIWGNIPTGGDTWSSTAMENTTGEKWVAENVVVSTTCNFGIRELTNGKQSGWIQADGASSITAAGKFACMYEGEGGANFSIAAGTWTITFDAAAFTLSVAGTSSDPTNQVTYYLIGDCNGWTSADEACKFVQSETNVAEYVLDYVGTIEAGTGFKINNGTWTNDNYNFGSNGTTIELGVAYKYTIAGTSENIILASEVTNPRFILNPSTQTLTMTKSTAVEDIEIEENVAPVYYNLQGVQVAEPANGLYIVVRGDKVSKELVK